MPVLVNVSHRVSDASTDLAVTNNPYMHENVVSDFYAALDAIREGGLQFVGFSELFRPFEVQVEYWRRYQANLSAAKKGKSKPYPNIVIAARPGEYPGRSNHGAGYSFDMPAIFRNRKLKAGPNKGKTLINIFEMHGFLHNQPGDAPHFNYKIKPTEAQKLEAQDYYKNHLSVSVSMNLPDFDRGILFQTC